MLNQLHQQGVNLILLRCTGFNHVDLQAADQLGLSVMRVATYSPHAVTEFTVRMILNLNRKIHRAHNRVHEGNFLLDGLLGFDLFGKTVGVIGTGAVGVPPVCGRSWRCRGSRQHSRTRRSSCGAPVLMLGARAWGRPLCSAITASIISRRSLDSRAAWLVRAGTTVNTTRMRSAMA